MNELFATMLARIETLVRENMRLSQELEEKDKNILALHNSLADKQTRLENKSQEVVDIQLLLERSKANVNDGISLIGIDEIAEKICDIHDYDPSKRIIMIRDLRKISSCSLEEAQDLIAKIIIRS